jgi:predicted ATP-grasp superfamily ATP-dependent carboligase
VGGSGRGSALVLDLDTRAGLCSVRSLGRAGAAVAGAARDASASGLRSRYLVRTVVLPSPEHDFEAYAAALLAEIVEHPVDAILSSIDVSVETLQRHRDEIGRHASPALAAPEAVELALNKDRTLELADSLGVPTPRSLRLTTPDDFEAAVAELSFPCVFKPETSWRPQADGGERLGPVLVPTVDDGRRLAVELIRPETPVLAQQLIPGVRETIKLFRVQGKTIARVAITIDRMWPPLGGSSVMRRTLAPPEDALQHAERLVAEVGLDGYSEAEFRRGVDGRPYLMEINPRLSQSVEVAVRAGVDFPRMQFEWARGGEVPSPAAAQLGLRVGWLAGDLRLLASGSAERPGFGTLASDYFVHRAQLEGFDRHDLRPVVGGLGFAFGRLRGEGRSTAPSV